MADIEIRPGTDTRYPSVRVRILHQPPDPLGGTTREIALVFRSGETRVQMRQAIDWAVRDYLASQAGTSWGSPTVDPRLLVRRTVSEVAP